MAKSSFDFFPSLPCELRLHVWKLAIRPPGAGVHRFSIFNKSQSVPCGSPLTALAGKACDLQDKGRRRRHVAAAPRVEGTRQEYSWTRGNSSASLWDAGLWTACRESRQVMMWHFRLQLWHDARRNLLRGGGFWSPAALAEEFEDITAMTVARDNGGERHFLVQPHRDLFWLEPQDWKSTVDWRTLFLDLPFSSSLPGHGHLSHIAIEYSPCWNVDLPKELGPLLQESTPRGFIARAMAECATNNLHCFIWLIDRRLARKTVDLPDAEEGLMAFYDCDHVYTETERQDLEDSQNGSNEEYEKTAVYFLHRLETIGNSDYTLMGGEFGSMDGFDFRVDDYLGVLACA